MGPRLRRNFEKLEKLRKDCLVASRSDLPFTVHLGDEVVPPSPEEINQLTSTMKARGAVFAARGPGFGYYTHETPVGAFDPSFFIFDNFFAREKNLWEFHPTSLLPHKVSVSGALAILILSRVGLKRFWRFAPAPPVTNDTENGGSLVRKLREKIVLGWIFRYRYGDMIWPRRLDPFYPEAIRPFSFDPEDLSP